MANDSEKQCSLPGDEGDVHGQVKPSECPPEATPTVEQGNREGDPSASAEPKKNESVPVTRRSSSAAKNKQKLMRRLSVPGTLFSFLTGSSRRCKSGFWEEPTAERKEIEAQASGQVDSSSAERLGPLGSQENLERSTSITGREETSLLTADEGERAGSQEHEEEITVAHEDECQTTHSPEIDVGPTCDCEADNSAVSDEDCTGLVTEVSPDKAVPTGSTECSQNSKTPNLDVVFTRDISRIPLRLQNELILALSLDWPKTYSKDGGKLGFSALEYLDLCTVNKEADLPVIMPTNEIDTIEESQSVIEEAVRDPEEPEADVVEHHEVQRIDEVAVEEVEILKTKEQDSEAEVGLQKEVESLEMYEKDKVLEELDVKITDTEQSVVHSEIANDEGIEHDGSETTWSKQETTVLADNATNISYIQLEKEKVGWRETDEEDMEKEKESGKTENQPEPVNCKSLNNEETGGDGKVEEADTVGAEIVEEKEEVEKERTKDIMAGDLGKVPGATTDEVAELPEEHKEKTDDGENADAKTSEDSKESVNASQKSSKRVNFAEEIEIKREGGQEDVLNGNAAGSPIPDNMSTRSGVHKLTEDQPGSPVNKSSDTEIPFPLTSGADGVSEATV